MTETTTPVEEQSSAVQPGDLTAKLAECREKAGLDLEQAADEMHLSANLLRSLEKEDFARLPEPPYVRGYLRGYAKLADMDAKELIRTYEALRGANPDEIAHHFAPSRSLGRVSQPRVSPVAIRLALLGALVIGLGMVVMSPSVQDWAGDTWASFSAKTAPPQVVRPAPALETFTAQKDAEEKAAASTPATPATTNTTDSTATTAPVAPTASATIDTTAPAAAPAAPATDTATVTPDSNAPEAASSTMPAALATAPTAAIDAPTVTPATASATDSATPATATTTTPPATATDGTVSATTAPPATAADGTTPATPPDAAATPTPIAGEVNVKLEFADEVWMQVKDDGKKTVFESLNSTGTTKEFKATTPLNFKVGNAPGVKIYLNGQLYDQAPYVKGSVARFKVE